MHRGGDANLCGPAIGPAALERRTGLLGQQAVRRCPRPSPSPHHWPAVHSNALRAGWIYPQRWAGHGCPRRSALAPVAQAIRPAVSDNPAATMTGSYFYHQRPRQDTPSGPRHRLPGPAPRLLTAVRSPPAVPLHDWSRASRLCSHRTVDGVSRTCGGPRQFWRFQAAAVTYRRDPVNIAII